MATGLRKAGYEEMSYETSSRDSHFRCVYGCLPKDLTPDRYSLNSIAPNTPMATINNTHVVTLHHR